MIWFCLPPCLSLSLRLCGEKKFFDTRERETDHSSAMTYRPPPLPVSPLAYDVGPGGARPGIITAMGVMSIIVACLSGLASLWALFFGLGMLMMSQIPRGTSTVRSTTITLG